ncbi:MAG: tetratricopeptide repeat protein [Alistipes sp.]|nr:tetratricopeptide repeat protein [Alistipes sp.]
MKTYFSIFIFALLAMSAPHAAAQESDVAAVDETVGETSPQPVAEMTADAMWDAANTCYVNGDYRAAIEGYEAILVRGEHSAKLYYNLANAYFKEGETGRAILFYRRALRLAPGSEDARYNLDVAAEMTKDRIEPVPEFFVAAWMRTVRNLLSPTVWAALSLAALAAMLSLALLYLLASSIGRRKTGFYGMLAALVVVIVATSFAAAGRRETVDRSEAVVMSSSVPVKSSPDKSATDLFVLHEGTVLRITDRLDEWCEVVIADGKKGWVRARHIEVI